MPTKKKIFDSAQAGSRLREEFIERRRLRDGIRATQAVTENRRAAQEPTRKRGQGEHHGIEGRRRGEEGARSSDGTNEDAAR